MGIGASATALIIYLFTRPAFDAATWAVAFVAGMLWTIGQMGQFISYTRIGVSGTIPLSAGFQLVGNSLIGVLIFGETVLPVSNSVLVLSFIYSLLCKMV
jgi:glucose uptake protein